MKIIRIGLDLAKSVFQVHGVDEREKPVLRRQLRRAQLLPFFANLPPCLVVMEACGGAHFWARALRKLGHDARMMAPQHVKAYLKGNKNDANDAAAICEAASRPSSRFIPVKEVEQQDIQAVHRIRSDLISQRTAKGNLIRGLLAEYGIAVAKSPRALRVALPCILEDAENGLTTSFRRLLAGLSEDLQQLDQRSRELDQEISRLARENETIKRLMSLPGVGPVIASAIVSAIGDGKQFKHGRDVSVWCGVTPCHNGTGGKVRIGCISKRGDAYLRTQVIHGARAVVLAAKNKTDPLSLWIKGLCERRNKNIAAVALASKTLRRAWAMLTSGEAYRDTTPMAQAA